MFDASLIGFFLRKLRNELKEEHGKDQRPFVRKVRVRYAELAISAFGWFNFRFDKTIAAFHFIFGSYDQHLPALAYECSEQISIDWVTQATVHKESEESRHLRQFNRPGRTVFQQPM